MNAPLSALVFHRSFSARSSRIKRFGTRCYALREEPGGYRHILKRMRKRAGWRAWMDCSSRSSRPLRSKTRNGACGARAVTAKRARSGAEGDCAAGTRSCGGRPLAGCRSVEQDGAWSRARGPACGLGLCAAECAGLRNKSADFGGAMRSAGLWAARRSERPWREPPAYADRIGRSAFDSSYSRNRDRRITALSRACICKSGGSSVGVSDIGGGSLGRALNKGPAPIGRIRTGGGALYSCLNQKLGNLLHFNRRSHLVIFHVPISGCHKDLIPLLDTLIGYYARVDFDSERGRRRVAHHGLGRGKLECSFNCVAAVELEIALGRENRCGNDDRRALGILLECDLVVVDIVKLPIRLLTVRADDDNATRCEIRVF